MDADINFVIPNKVRDLQFAAKGRFLTSFGMTVHTSATSLTNVPFNPAQV
jgi:hypothetical protein